MRPRSRKSPAAWPVKKPRIAIYEPWGGNIDEGWTRWILEQFHFPFTRLHNADIQAGHLRDQFDTIVIAEMGTRQIMDGMRAGHRCRANTPAASAKPARRRCAISSRRAARWSRLGNATLFAIDQFNLPSRTWCGRCGRISSSAPARCCESEIKEPNHPVVAGLPASPRVMFERNPVFDTKPGFRGKVLASYVKDRNPLLSGFLLGADLIEGKAAALDANYGNGHIIMLGFPAAVARPIARHLQILLQRALLQPVDGARRRRRGRTRRTRRRRQSAAGRVATRSRSGEGRADQAGRSESRLLHGARPATPPRKARSSKTALDAFQRDRLPLLDDLRAQVEDAATVAQRRHLLGAAQEVRRGPAHQGFQRLQAGGFARSIQTGGGAYETQSR